MLPAPSDALSIGESEAIALPAAEAILPRHGPRARGPHKFAGQRDGGSQEMGQLNGCFPLWRGLGELPYSWNKVCAFDPVAVLFWKGRLSYIDTKLHAWQTMPSKFILSGITDPASAEVLIVAILQCRL